MKKRFYALLIFGLSIISVNAQSQNSQEKMQTLVQRVDSLEHELSYLKLTHELSTLNSDMTLFSNEIHTKSLEIQLYLYNRNFNSQLGYVYQLYYKSCQEKKQAISELIETEKTFFVLKVITYPFSESEMNALKAKYKVIDKAYESIGKSMELLKIVMDTYNESL